MTLEHCVSLPVLPHDWTWWQAKVFLALFSAMNSSIVCSVSPSEGRLGTLVCQQVMLRWRRRQGHLGHQLRWRMSQPGSGMGYPRNGGWVNERMREWENGWMGEWEDGWMGEWENERMREWVNERMGEWESERMGEWENERMKEWENGWMRGWME